MNKYRNSDLDIHVRIYKFVTDCFKDVVKKISKSAENIVIISQLTSSLTSIGANDQEADGASSKKDFIAKYSIVKKELKETRYWLSFIRDCYLLEENIVDPYALECQQILLIVSTIILKTQHTN